MSRLGNGLIAGLTPQIRKRQCLLVVLKYLLLSASMGPLMWAQFSSAATPTPRVVAVPSPSSTPAVTASALPTSTTPSSTDQLLKSDSVAVFQYVLTEQSKHYQEFLRAETDRHQAWTHEIFELAGKSFGAGLALFLAFIGWSQWKTLASARAEIASQFQAKTGVLIDARLEEFVKHIGASKARVDEQVKEVKDIGQQALSDLQNRVDQQREEMLRQLDTLVDCASVVGYATVVLRVIDEGSRTPEEKVQTAQKIGRQIAMRLETLHRTMPTNRTIAIFVGRITRVMGDLEKAIAFLEETIKARETKGLDNNVDHAAVLYNKACYLNLLAAKEAEPDKQETLRQQAWRVLRQCVQLSGADRQEAQEDPDFEGIISPPVRDWATL